MSPDPAAPPATDAAALRAVVLAGLGQIAPEVDPTTLRGDVSLREQVDLDSMDFLNLLIGVHERLGVDIAEDDYARCETLDGLADAFVEAAARTRR
jgi:acyl carrier protein